MRASDENVMQPSKKSDGNGSLDPGFRPQLVTPVAMSEMWNQDFGKPSLFVYVAFSKLQIREVNQF